MSKDSKQVFEFGPFRVDVEESRLIRDGESVPLWPKAFEILRVLVESRGRMLTKDELMSRVWPDTFVEENNLTVNMSALRKALGEGVNGAKYIETIPRRGYRFVAEVCELTDAGAPLILTRQTVSSIIIEEEEEEDSKEVAGKPFVRRAIDSSALPLALPAARVNRPFTTWLGALAVVLVAALLYFWFANRPRPIQTIGDVRSIAVLPFKSLGAAEEDESLRLGLADALITKLSNIHPVIVRPTSSIVKYADSQQSLSAIGQELGVEALLEGRLQRDADRLRITVQLVRTDNGAPVWAESFDERLTNIFAVQTAISERVARALALRLTSEQQTQLIKNPTQNAEAFQAYIKGRYFWNKRTPESIKKAIGYFNQAIEIDPTYALAYSGIADCYIILGRPQVMLVTTTESDDFSKAKAAALKALEIDDSLAEAHASLAIAQAAKEDNNEAAHREFERAIALNPNYATAYNYYAITLIGDGRLDEALEKITRAVEIDPLSVPIITNHGIVLYRLRRYDEAIAELKKSIEMNPAHARAHWGLGLAYEQKGMYREAIAEFKQSITLSNGGAVGLSALAHAYAGSGRRQEAQVLLAELQEGFRQGRVDAYSLAMVYVGLDDKEQALALIEKHRQESRFRLLKVDQHFDPLRADPRFARLLQRD
jgi:DNA-binding winged helix-turn-helix (wHTH) protein/TolB-like protein/Flp pilus assembly protein TadD